MVQRIFLVVIFGAVWYNDYMSGETGVIPVRARRRDALNILSSLPDVPQLMGQVIGEI